MKDKPPEKIRSDDDFTVSDADKEMLKYQDSNIKSLKCLKHTIGFLIICGIIINLYYLTSALFNYIK